MRVFRRRSPGPGAPGASQAAAPGAGAAEAEPPAAARPGLTAAKGRPTPKRSEAQSRRRQPYSAPGDRKAAGQKSREQDRVERQRRMVAMRRGEEWALPRKDKGPVRALARDYVDSRRTLSEYYLYAVVLLVAALFVPGLHKSVLFDYIFLGVLAVLVVEAYLIGRRVVRLAQQRYPGESTHGVRLYAAMRGTQMRRLRLPPPRVKIGDKI